MANSHLSSSRLTCTLVVLGLFIQLGACSASSRQPTDKEAESYLASVVGEEYLVAIERCEAFPDAQGARGRLSCLGKMRTKADWYGADASKGLAELVASGLTQDEAAFYLQRANVVLASPVTAKGAEIVLHAELFYERRVDSWALSGDPIYKPPVGTPPSRLNAIGGLFNSSQVVRFDSQDWTQVKQQVITDQKRIVGERAKLIADINKFLASGNVITGFGGAKYRLTIEEAPTWGPYIDSMTGSRGANGMFGATFVGYAKFEWAEPPGQTQYHGTRGFCGARADNLPKRIMIAGDVLPASSAMKEQPAFLATAYLAAKAPVLNYMGKVVGEEDRRCYSQVTPWTGNGFAL